MNIDESEIEENRDKQINKKENQAVKLPAFPLNLKNKVCIHGGVIKNASHHVETLP